ncbi:non-hydrolyzing UDP-N-acetylglucosamine 2-epimerase [Dyadobacter sandarakinus]|uniref:UDP-N-acetylglucosamine 2-epimerase (Non-hydrolyzing) n=1 Tax=Dyadobacter sandarakinus TaxID=2747268 RepID=A0ABX7I746_9BACT|nr:UDP-N-acetylglucosamine 2-epimerase (non-hydrolyzing) [Dyadobacter sandarakinus]QRR01924.1 UDP-N-acetylglucosamine 2-epimerase (non-hydrolyzing) [Dyadobacter sandarakinus]
MKVINVVGARPNFMKVAPLHRAFSRFPEIHSIVVHTGQHSDACMSDVFLEQLKMPPPDYLLRLSAASATCQFSEIMTGFEKILQKEKPDLVLVAGDVNSTLACALAASKADIPVAHVEAGLRSGDRSMPEEINRILTDALSAHLFVTEPSAVQNLLLENVPMQKIHLVGNVMIDSLIGITGSWCPESATNISEQSRYILWTMHRPSNVDTEVMLTKMLAMITHLARRWTVLFPVHPRTMKNLCTFGLADQLCSIRNVQVLPPQGYMEFLKLMTGAMVVVTDSGGVQEETTFLQIPCITLRESTERPVTVERGSNLLLYPFDEKRIEDNIAAIQQGLWKKGSIPEYWDGRTAERIVSILKAQYLNL